MLKLSTIKNNIIARATEVYRFIRFDRSIEAAVVRAVIAASIIVAIGLAIRPYVEPAAATELPSATTGACL